MLVKEIMKRKVIALQKDNSIADAITLLKQHHIRHIPIINESSHVIGIVSDRDVRDASPSVLDKRVDQSLLNQSIGSIMTSPVITTHPHEYFEDIAPIFYENEIACIPVVYNMKLVGIVTEKDMLHTFIQLTGTHSPSTQIEIKVPDRVGVLSEVSSYFSKRKIKIVSVYTYPSPGNEEWKVLVFRIQTMNPLAILQDFEQTEYEIMYPIREEDDEFM
ncbi:acetoin utilization protein AcuB [Gracilibacillus ureilyticus]|uniref:Acetoin utilization protein AcuB n=1 Tax=Gracilibacillus ureilyticus TaxID=531814 RepID=A0A1H9TE23_9BACI|nr:CBS and ACT domain-containing protein [Gracilibacillus ureilyticus]SER94853.1 acetoin utilization protein AcuB [Gracilibacillus ureilyticus]